MHIILLFIFIAHPFHPFPALPIDESFAVLWTSFQFIAYLNLAKIDLPNMVELTAAEVAKHKSRSDLWFIIRGKVYNVTKFIDEHPGGEEVMLEYGGADATDAFEDVGHSESARELLDQYLLGPLVGSSKAAVNYYILVFFDFNSPRIL
jgi:cytochrome b involved in lipid metabolism